ncbi:hypothetical protein PFISCL1PPCAC_21475, partial [Pristionchus fissidentatus]
RFSTQEYLESKQKDHSSPQSRQRTRNPVLSKEEIRQRTDLWFQNRRRVVLPSDAERGEVVGYETASALRTSIDHVREKHCERSALRRETSFTHEKAADMGLVDRGDSIPPNAQTVPPSPKRIKV